MTTNSSIERAFGDVESLAKDTFSMLQRGIGLQAQQRLMMQLLAQVGMALNSGLGKDALAELESRVRVLLHYFSGRSQLTVVIAEFLRTQIKELEAGARRLRDIADADYSHSAHDVGIGVRSHHRQAAAIRHEALAQSEIARRIAGACAPLTTIIPSDFDILTSKWGLDAERILSEASSAGHTAAAIVPAAVPSVAGPGVEQETAAHDGSALAVSRYSYHFGADKERALRHDAHALADSLCASMSGLRRVLDDAQHPGSYDVAALHAVTQGLHEDATRLERTLAVLVEKSWARVSLVG